MTEAERFILANVLERVQETDAALWKVCAILESRTPDPMLWHSVISAQMGVNYIEGRIRGLLAEPIPAQEGE